MIWNILKKSNDLDLSANDTIIILKNDDLKFLRTEKVFNVLFPYSNKDNIESLKNKNSNNRVIICPGISELDGYLRSLRTSSSKKYTLLTDMLKELVLEEMIIKKIIMKKIKYLVMN